MSTAKEELRKLAENQLADSSYEELVRELAFDLMVKRGFT